MQEPLILDRYRPLADLGSGGHGSVVLAFDTRMARRVAVKVLPLPRGSAGTGGRAGLAEARTAALLNHPNIVTVYEWDADEGSAYIVMEDVDGASLADLLDRAEGPLTAEEVAAVVEAVGAALSFAHRNGVLHLDLKPANVLVTREGRVTVADFGVAALTDATGRATGTSGTIGYMPPEQLRGQALDTRTDLWAFAALVYELLTDANPFDAENAEGSLFKIEVADTPAPSEFEPGLSRAIDDILIAALDPDPDARYERADEFMGALLPFLGDARAGRESLCALVAEAIGERQPETEEQLALGLWDRLAPYGAAARRLGYAAGCGWLSVGALDALGLGPIPTLGGAALVALAGLLAPGLALALALLALTAGATAAFGVLTGAGVGLLGGVFWVTNGRHGLGDGLAPLAAPLLGIARGALSVPLWLGFAFEPLVAAPAAAFASVATAAAAALTGTGSPLLAVRTSFAIGPLGATVPLADVAARLLTPGTLGVAALWAAAAGVTSLACRRGTRPAGVIGMLLGSAVLGAGYAGSLVVGSGAEVGGYLPDLVVGASAGLLLAALGAPMRPDRGE